MPPSNAMENDKKRLRNQFTKDERSRLLAIMTEYGPLLDDKNISILSRKEIWEIIENKFNENGHSGRTSAQLKKYWQNYKYHSKRAKIIQKEVPKTLSPITKQMVRMLAKVNPENWARYDVEPGATPTKTSSESSRTSSGFANAGLPFTTDSNIAMSESGTGNCSPVPKNRASTPQRSQKLSASGASSSSAGESRARPGGKGKSETAERNVVFATTDVPGSSVTVSLICPEVQSKVRSIFWKRNAPPPDLNVKLQLSHDNEGRNSPDSCSRHELGNSDISHDANGKTKGINQRREKLAGENNGSQRSTLIDVAGTFAGNKSKRSAVNAASDSDKRRGGIRQVPGMDDRLIRCVAVPRRGVGKNQSSMNVTEATTGRENQSNFIGNVPGVVKEISRAKEGRVSVNCDSVKTLERSHSMINGENEMTEVSTSGGGGGGGGGGGAPKRLRSSAIPSREYRDVKDVNDGSGDADYPEFNETLSRYATAESFRRAEILDDIKEMLETFKAASETPTFDADDKGAAGYLTKSAKSRENPSTQDFSWFELLYMRLLREVAEPGRSQYLKALRKFESVISVANSTEKGNADDEVSTDSDPVDGEQGAEVDEGGNSETRGAGKLRVRRVSSMTPAPSEDQVRREIKVETEEGQEIVDLQADDPVNAVFGNDPVMNSMNCLMQAKLRCARSETDHRLQLQKLEIAEKELRVKIAETSVQEARLRIQALVEERFRAKKIHELQLAQISAENTRSEAEHAARLDASGVAAAESRSRLSSVERDRERSENFYQMQLRYMSGSNAPGNGVNDASDENGVSNVDSKRCQQ